MILYNFLAVLFFCLLFLFFAKKYERTEKIIYILITIFVLTLILINNLLSYE